MKYFTPQLLDRLASTNDAVADAAHDEWERALLRWKRRWPKIKSAFPRSVWLFEDANICLHDARVLSLAQNSESFVMILQREKPATDVVLLTFTLAAQPIIDHDAAPGHGDGRLVNWLYEEWDVDRRGHCWFEVLLSNAWSVRLCFRDFQFQVLPQVLAAQSETTMPRSA